MWSIVFLIVLLILNITILLPLLLFRSRNTLALDTQTEIHDYENVNYENIRMINDIRTENEDFRHPVSIQMIQEYENFRPQVSSPISHDSLPPSYDEVIENDKESSDPPSSYEKAKHLM